MFLRYNHNN